MNHDKGGNWKRCAGYLGMILLLMAVTLLMCAITRKPPVEVTEPPIVLTLPTNEVVVIVSEPKGELAHPSEVPACLVWRWAAGNTSDGITYELYWAETGETLVTAEEPLFAYFPDIDKHYVVHGERTWDPEVPTFDECLPD
jgi:hypothetical protein